MDALTIHEAAQTTGWSPRMLRYVERVGLLELLEEHDLGLSDVAFALRLREDAGLRGAVDGWLAATAQRPEHVPAPDWLRWEQEKHSKLLAVAAAQAPPTLMETR